MENTYGHGIAWRRGPMLGKGSFGSVYLATAKNPSIHYRCLPLVMAVKSAEVSVSSSLQKEREVLSYLSGCPDIIQCVGDETTIGSDGRMVYNLLLEYGSGGTIADRIKKSGYRGLPLREVRCFTKSILKGLSYIHEVGFVHCDLKPENILLVPKSRKTNTEFIAKICDFGLARRVQKSKKRKLERYFNGTPMYLSPEAVRDGVQGTPCDIWSLGCVVLEMLTGKPAWDEGMDEESALNKIGKGTAVPKKPRNLCQSAKSFLNCCLKRMVKGRLSAKTLLHHPFVNGLNDDDDDYDYDNDNGVLEEEDIDDMDEDCSCLSAEH
ncbi:mitogen-activated protein kinase kinase kinase 17-like [Coffea eugenioides]|uniref:mitogen-activated protein kinase kinase kinase 17-like n=1 Tax=Coffea eugenioides TaxID=49369 RepID=UPI000F61239F|nr:mitogen-activated protein kinase kinase kinase 17-like [Coffea eugenioides]XP_027152478.1 mitogen-activated protein kinase kinase kinase 17-like [Coffea eugenioides]